MKNLTEFAQFSVRQFNWREFVALAIRECTVLRLITVAQRQSAVCIFAMATITDFHKSPKDAVPPNIYSSGAHAGWFDCSRLQRAPAERGCSTALRRFLPNCITKAVQDYFRRFVGDEWMQLRPHAVVETSHAERFCVGIGNVNQWLIVPNDDSEFCRRICARLFPINGFAFALVRHINRQTQQGRLNQSIGLFFAIWTFHKLPVPFEPTLHGSRAQWACN